MYRSTIGFVLPIDAVIAPANDKRASELNNPISM
jgi:hypothetical protein